jgi:hypothetical protein
MDLLHNGPRCKQAIIYLSVNDLLIAEDMEQTKKNIEILNWKLASWQKVPFNNINTVSLQMEWTISVAYCCLV